MRCTPDKHADPMCYGRAQHPRPAIVILQSHWTPQSRGTVLARSADPRVPPAIRTKGLTAAAEIAAFLRATAHPRDSRHGPAGFGAQYRNPSRNPGGSDAALEKWIRETANSTDHPACTAAMGADPDSVLDERLRVRGVNGLRVAKAR
ncbi:GMC oxidoreductase [Mycobacterium sp.]|uniref:GMC oxidoreductase n=1 Tax=Mycobacterium sp. TaxID=1785 RepID=UPI0039C930F0